MKVRLIAKTQPTIEGLTTSNDFIAYCARVSNPGNQFNTVTAPKLLQYLIKHQHWSPFEMAHAVIEITTTRDISRQIIRHRSFSFQEYSQRYAEATGFVTREARLQDKKNRQNSIEMSEEQSDLMKEWFSRQSEVLTLVKDSYAWALENGIAKEQARAILPEGNTVTTLLMSGTVRSWIHYCALRTLPETQKEHRLVAQKCWAQLVNHFPDIRSCVTESC